MSSRLEKDFAFQAAIHHDGNFILNLYDLTLSMLVETSDPFEQNVAMERAFYFLNTIVQNVIFVNKTEKEAIEKYKQAGIRVCEIPDEPYDQIIGALLLLKLNAIMENRLHITDLLLGTSVNAGVRFTIYEDSAETMFPDADWWNTPGCSISVGDKTEEKASNVLTLFNKDEQWKELGLSWKKSTKQN